MAGKQDFSYSAQRIAKGLVSVEVRGYLDAAASQAYLGELRRLIEDTHRTDQQAVGLIFKDSLSGFDPGTAAKLHGKFFREMGDRVQAVAIVSKRLSMRFGVAGAKLFAKQPIEILADEQAASVWLGKQSANRASAGSPRH